jgi:hypothetical protein
MQETGSGFWRGCRLGGTDAERSIGKGVGRSRAPPRWVLNTEAEMAIDLDEVGVHGDAAGVRFGLYLPGVTAADGFSVDVRVINLADQFVPEIRRARVGHRGHANHQVFTSTSSAPSAPPPGS